MLTTLIGGATYCCVFPSEFKALAALLAGPGETHCLEAVRGIVGEGQRARGGTRRGWGERHTDGAVGPGGDTRPAGVAGYREACARYDVGRN